MPSTIESSPSTISPPEQSERSGSFFRFFKKPPHEQIKKEEPPVVHKIPVKTETQDKPQDTTDTENHPLPDKLDVLETNKQNLIRLADFERDLGIVTTDSKTLVAYYKAFQGKEVGAVTTDKFLDRSKKEYNAPWLSRELIQNFVDHNQKDRGTLNGVEINREILENGTHKFTIKGNWDFLDNTGVLSPHSEKPEGVKTAGGNGIGLKQAAIRLIRDFDATRFQIDGTNWTINYQMSNAQKINEDLTEQYKLRQQSPIPQVKHEWLIGVLEKTQKTGQCIYTIETKNPELIEAFEQLNKLGVSNENPFLQNPDFKNPNGAIKWLPLDSSGKPNYGRIFVNGQVMNYEKKGDTVENYFQGPEYLTLQLNGIDYDMNVDRPPIQTYKMETYSKKLLDSMSNSELLGQLQRSEYLWSNIEGINTKSYGDPGCLVFIRAIVSELDHAQKENPDKEGNQFNKKDFLKICGDKNYLAKDSDLDKDQVKKLKEQGYIICPNFFEKIGMPLASTKLDIMEQKKNEIPGAFEASRGFEKLAKTSGVLVGFEDFSEVKNTQEFFLVLKDRLKNDILSWEENNDKPGTFRISLAQELPSDLLSKPLFRPKKDDRQQVILYLIRGLAQYGLTNNIFPEKGFITSQKDYLTTFSIDNMGYSGEKDGLIIKNVEMKNNQGSFVEFTLSPDLAQQFKEIMGEKKIGSLDVKSEKAPEPQFNSVNPVVEKTRFPVDLDELVTKIMENNVNSAPEKNSQELHIPLKTDKTKTPSIYQKINHLEILKLMAEDQELHELMKRPRRESPEKDEDEEEITPEEMGEAVDNIVDRDKPITREEAKEIIETLKDSLSQKELRKFIKNKEWAMLKKEFYAIPVKQPKAPVTAREQNVIDKIIEKSAGYKEKIEQIAKKIPEIEDAVNKLEQLVEDMEIEEKEQTPGENDPIKAYVEWRKSGNFYGEVGKDAGYLTPKHLVEIIEENESADIAVVNAIDEDNSPEEGKIGRLNSRLQNIVNSMSLEKEDRVDDFSIELSPTTEEMAQLGLLRTYMIITTKSPIVNDMFLYNGTGSRGINISQKAIGIHKALLKESFDNILSTMMHELGHNYSMKHDNNFIKAIEALSANDRIEHRKIITKLSRGQELNEEESVITHIEDTWEKLRRNK